MLTSFLHYVKIDIFSKITFHTATIHGCIFSGIRQDTLHSMENAIYPIIAL